MYNFYTTAFYYNPLSITNELVEEIIVDQEEATSAVGVYKGGFREGIWMILNKKGKVLRKERFHKGEFIGIEF